MSPDALRTIGMMVEAAGLGMLAAATERGAHAHYGSLMAVPYWLVFGLVVAVAVARVRRLVRK